VTKEPYHKFTKKLVPLAALWRHRNHKNWYFEKIAKMAEIHDAAAAAVKSFMLPLLAFLLLGSPIKRSGFYNWK
jgi:hypothetical protein